MNHVGAIRDVLATGMIPTVIYPNLHILSATLIDITGLSAASQLAILSTTAILLFCLTSFLLARYAHIPITAVLLFVPIAYVPASVSPSKFTWTALFPLILFLSLRVVDTQNERTRISIVLLPVILTIWIYHVIPAFIATVYLALVGVLAVRQRGLPRFSWSKEIMPFFLLSASFGYLWAINSGLFKRGVAQIAIKLLPSRSGPTKIFSQKSLAATLLKDFGLSPIDVVVLALREFGGVIVVCSMAGLGVILYLSDFGPRAVPKRYQIPAAICVVIVGAGFWSGAQLVANVIPHFNFKRALRPAIYGGLVACGSVVYVSITAVRHLITRNGTATVRVGSIITGIVVIILVATPIIGATMVVYGSTYDSPDTVKANHQILPSDLAGMGWYFDYKNRNIKTTTLWRFNFRYVTYLLSPTEEAARYDELDARDRDREYRAPAHFGYRNNTTVAQSIGCRYYIEGKFDRATYLDARPSKKFTRSDFRQLQADPTVRQVYSNGNFNISKIGKC